MDLLRRGSSGPAVAEVQSVLSALGLLGSNGSAAQPAVYDEATELAVRHFQQSNQRENDRWQATP